MILKSIGVFILLCMSVSLASQEVIPVTRFGAAPNSKQNVMPALKQALQYSQNKSEVVISFPKGRYDFWPTQLAVDADSVGFRLFKHQGVIIEGNGSEFIFHGRMEIANVDSCSNIIFRNFTVDWERPMMSQAEIIGQTDSYLDVKIDRDLYPYVIRNGRILFLGEGWNAPVIQYVNNMYDKEKHEIVYNTWDGPMGDIFQQKAEELPNGIVRFHGKTTGNGQKGDIVSLYHDYRSLNLMGFHICNSKDIVLKDLQIYHCLSHGVLCERTENLTMDHASMMTNETKGRVFSIMADASHFVNCKGLVKIVGCAHSGQGDDFINVHGRNIVIDQLLDEKSVAVNLDGRYVTAGDEVWLISRETAQRGEVRVVELVTPVNEGDVLKGYHLTFTQALPKALVAGDIVENKTWTAGLELRDCQILKKNRARGILVTTPQDVVIENNYFRTAGTAILIEGDTDFWFESGANRNVQIRHNVFEDCLTSACKTGDRWEWGEAVITITPSHRPKDVYSEPYHQNIDIHDNVFKVFDVPLIHARSVRNLLFNNNEVIKTSTYKPYLWQRFSFLLDGCRHVEIKNNILDETYDIRDIRIEHMKKSDVKVAKNQRFNLGFLEE